MLEDIALLLLGAPIVFAVRYLYDRWNSRAPFPDGLYPGERLISSTRAMARVDNAFRVGHGFAYLTDHRLIWTPEVGRRRLFSSTPSTGLYSQPLIIELPQVRKVDARFRLGGGRLVLETTDMRLELIAEGKGFGSWERSIQAGARQLLPPGQPVLRVHDRYSRQEVLANSKGYTLFVALFIFYVGARLLDFIVETQGGSLSEAQFIGILVAAVALMLAAVAWETRPR